MLHDDVVNELRSCGSSVTLTVCPFDGANRLLSTKKSMLLFVNLKLLYYEYTGCSINTVKEIILY